MQTWEVEDPTTGFTVKVQGVTVPTEPELIDIFAHVEAGLIGPNLDQTSMHGYRILEIVAPPAPNPATLLSLDMTGDGSTTITDIGMALKHVFFLPGDLLLWLMMKFPALGRFFELTHDSYQNAFSGIVSIFFWLIVWYYIWAFFGTKEYE